MNKEIEVKYPILNHQIQCCISNPSKILLKKILDNNNYFLSLLQHLRENNFIAEEELKYVQIQIQKILQRELCYYTKEESSSVREEVAESILLSICYTISLYFKNLPNIMESVDILKSNSIEEIYKEGKKIIEILFIKSKELFCKANENKVITKNYAYNDTIGDGIGMFFEQYDMRFGSHTAPCSVDYPLFVDIMDYIGVEYIYSYLSLIYIENEFCSYFNIEHIEALLDSYDNECDQLLVNIFKMVLLNSLASILINKCATNLFLSRENIKFIESQLRGKGHKEISDIIFKAINRCFSELNITDEVLRKHIISSGEEISKDIINAVKLNKLETVFIEYRERNKKNLVYIDKKAVSNEKFREITNEIRGCRLVDDKIKIIKNKIQSLEDLYDLLCADCIYEDEFLYIFKSLENLEIALLLKYSKIPIYINDYNDFEKEWNKYLYNYLYSLNNNRKERILKIYNEIEI